MTDLQCLPFDDCARCGRRQVLVDADALYCSKCDVLVRGREGAGEPDVVGDAQRFVLGVSLCHLTPVDDGQCDDCGSAGARRQYGRFQLCGSCIARRVRVARSTAQP
jgi:hypothetical protein